MIDLPELHFLRDVQVNAVGISETREEEDPKEATWRFRGPGAV